MLLTPTATVVDAHARAISVIIMLYATAPASSPPSAFGTFTPRNPAAATFARLSWGKPPSRSSRAARGASTSAASARARSRSSRCASLGSKSKAVIARKELERFAHLSAIHVHVHDFRRRVEDPVVDRGADARLHAVGRHVGDVRALRILLLHPDVEHLGLRALARRVD